MKDKKFEDLFKQKTKGVIKSYTVINPKKHLENFSESVSNSIEAPVEIARSNINLLKTMIGNNDKKLSYEEIYKLVGADENLRQKNYTNFSIISLIMFIFVIAVIVVGCFKTYNAVDSVGRAMSILSYAVGAAVPFSVYFRNVVRAYGLKYATVDNKLNAFKSLENLLPNPFYDVRAATNSKNEAIEVYLETKEEQERNK
ncbi:TPA: hypothetical protein ACMEXA_005626 [Klebsiella variicola subsp. variicola]|jgi:hypothetical protein|uniref:hypothetical protein n=1 Tax=Klebsiella variicola TaxID=244366 RepID=UPI001CD025E9|nr:hypothetical protein [Klebsiella variicola]HBQ8857482.1 hypothetical protein [Klebsiella variicola subsp. variicola]HBQ8869323.1 hypothetical protein [Klebsiella pneumoniae]MEC5999716.1 hypothetical protein [Klebsiella variicola]UBN00592.1 hypothetical protein LB484_29455 [Klebsiella variicola]HBQ8863790.1 hypothetical protein [Klebsiella variicola subsp. variicola]